MVKYSCERCGKEFSQKSHYDSHNRRKTPCENNADKIKALVDKAVEEKLKECDIFISVGTSGTVYPAAGFSKIAKNKRAYTINVNISKSHSWNFKEEITGPASTALKKLLDKIKSGHYDEIVKERKKKKRAVS